MGCENSRESCEHHKVDDSTNCEKLGDVEKIDTLLPSTVSPATTTEPSPGGTRTADPNPLLPRPNAETDESGISEPTRSTDNKGNTLENHRPPLSPPRTVRRRKASIASDTSTISIHSTRPMVVNRYPPRSLLEGMAGGTMPSHQDTYSSQGASPRSSLPSNCEMDLHPTLWEVTTAASSTRRSLAWTHSHPAASPVFSQQQNDDFLLDDLHFDESASNAQLPLDSQLLSLYPRGITMGIHQSPSNHPRSILRSNSSSSNGRRLSTVRRSGGGSSSGLFGSRSSLLTSGGGGGDTASLGSGPTTVLGQGSLPLTLVVEQQQHAPLLFQPAMESLTDYSRTIPSSSLSSVATGSSPAHSGWAPGGGGGVGLVSVATASLSGAWGTSLGSFAGGSYVSQFQVQSVQGESTTEPDTPGWWADYLSTNAKNHHQFEVDYGEIYAHFQPPSAQLVEQVNTWDGKNEPVYAMKRHNLEKADE